MCRLVGLEQMNAGGMGGSNATVLRMCCMLRVPQPVFRSLLQRFAFSSSLLKSVCKLHYIA
jgi:hypothetical protein